jgi:hypothetical protein
MRHLWNVSDNSLEDTLPSKLAGPGRRYRSSFTAEQIDALEQFFTHNPYPDVSTRENLSQRLDIDESRVQIWFSNRRARNRKTPAKQFSPQNSPVFGATESTAMQSFLESPANDMNMFPNADVVFDPSVTSSPSSSKSQLRVWARNHSSFVAAYWPSVSPMCYTPVNAAYYPSHEYYLSSSPSAAYANYSMPYPSFY